MQTQASSLSKTGYTPLLVLWQARALYIGPAFGLSAHRNAVAVLAVGLEAAFGVANDPHDVSAGYRWCRTALIAPNQWHHLKPQGLMAFLYLDALSRDAQNLVLEGLKNRVTFKVQHEQEIIACLNQLAAGAAWSDIRDTLEQHLGLHHARAVDPRMLNAITRLRQNINQNLSAGELAAAAGLSVSRFLHLFKATTGVPFRRFRLWNRFEAATRAIKSGKSLTEAAHEVGFASSAHLSAAFREMFGVAPSGLNLDGLRLIDNNQSSPTNPS